MRTFDWVVLVGSLVFVVAYGMWRGRGSDTTSKYLLAGQDHALVRHGALHHGHAGQRDHVHLDHRAGLRRRHALRAVLFRPADRDGDFSVTAVPIFHRADVYTAYEYLEQRFDAKTRALVSIDFPDLARLAAGVALSAPAIVLTVILGWPDRSPPSSWAFRGLYTVTGGIKAVTWTDFQQMLIMFAGLFVALVMAIWLLPADVSFLDAVYARGRGRQAERGTTDVRLERPLQHLERPVRRHVPGAGLLRHAINPRYSAISPANRSRKAA